MNVFSEQKDYRGNLFSQIFFFWLEKFFFKGFRNTLTQSDLHPCPKEQRSKELYERFEKHWQVELKKVGTPDIKIPLAKTLYYLFLIGGIFFFIEMIFYLAQAILVYHFSSLCTGDSANGTSSGWGPSLGIAFVISIITITTTIIHSLAFYFVYYIGIQMRSICVSAIYKKILRIQQSVLHKISIGHIINLASNDVFKFDVGSRYCNAFWLSPIVLTLSTIIILVYIGAIGLIGIGYIMLHTPLQIVLGFIFGHFRYKLSITADKRIQLMDQIIRGMRVIKFYVWEAPFSRYIGKIRRKGIFYASLSGIIQSTTFSFFNTSIFIALLLIFSVSIALGQTISPPKLALAFIVFNALRLSNVLFLGHAIFSFRECVIALRRIQRVLLLPENIENRLVHKPSSLEENPSIEFVNFSASWKGTENEHFDNSVLRSISLRLDHPQLVAVAGPIGAGKSSILLSIINELPGLSGRLCISGILSYAAQVPWIFSGTIRDNIIFGNTLAPPRYQEVVLACSLKEDIDCFEEGDLTLIGERGVTLSGGQKARISLARAVYHEADIYLFDDPLSAVDVRVGREIFEKCVRGLLKQKLILMVTHQINYVIQSDLIVMMNEGSIVSSGTYEEIVSDNEFCGNFLLSLKKKEKNVKTETKESTIEETRSIDSSEPERVPFLIANIEKDDRKSTEVQPLSSAMTAEDYRPNTITLVTYLRYFWAGGFLATLVMLVLTVLGNGGLLLAYWWMQSMAECTQFTVTNQSIGMSNGTSLSISWYYDFCNPGALVVLTIITFSSSVFLFLRGFNFYYIVLQAGRRLHNRMLRRLVHTPMHFFDTNPSGRILNRFAKDIGFLDEQLPMAFYDFWHHCSYNFAIIIAICVVQYYLIIPFSIMLVCMLALRYYYLRTSTQVKQLESVARSPLYSHISLTLQGLSTIRALRIEKRVTQDLHLLQDQHACTWYYYMCCHRWFGIRLDLMTSLVVVTAVFYSFITRCIFSTEELVGFSIPLLLSLAATFQYMIRQSGEVEVLMVSVDRILNYCKLPQEPLYISNTQLEPSLSSGHCGVIEFKNVHFRYSDHLPYSLTDVSLRVCSGEKIGIVGRTGAGKTSLLSSLLRINPISSGSIYIDSRDISSVDLYEHRKRLSVIPQDPFLFSGTLQYNLDPFDEFSAAELWSALDKAHMKRMVESLPDQLRAGVEEDGLNFSTGERQLLCLARAILRKNKIILIDEATANVDMHTDALVQQAIRTHFSDCSVLTIAHRIETIIDSDRIVILDKGKIVEADIPYLMLQDENSYLSKLVSQLEADTQYNLRKLAEKSYRALQLST